MNLLYNKIGTGIIRLYSRLMLKLDIRLHGGMPAGSKIFIANHPSATDPFILHLLSREPLAVMIVSTAFSFPLFGEFIRRTGQIQVVPGEGNRAIEQARAYLKAGYSVGIFPEGGFSPQSGGFREPRSGAARLALTLGKKVPVIPVGIYLPRERIIKIESRMSGKHAVGYWYLRGPYGITIGDPLRLKGNVDDETQVRSQAKKMMKHIKLLALESERRVRKHVPMPIRT